CGVGRGGEVLDEGDTFAVEMFGWGPGAYAVQFHPEVTHAMMCRWTTRGAARMDLPGARPRMAHFEGRAAYDYAIREWLAAFLEPWIGPAARAPGAAGPRHRTKADASPARARAPRADACAGNWA